MEKIICLSVVKPQGIKGELKAKILADGFNSIKNVKKLYDVSGKEYSVSKIRDAFGGFAFVTLSGVVTRNDAELFRGVDFFVEKSQINKASDEYFIADIIGLEVIVDGVFEGGSGSAGPKQPDRSHWQLSGDRSGNGAAGGHGHLPVPQPYY